MYGGEGFLTNSLPLVHVSTHYPSFAYHFPIKLRSPEIDFLYVVQSYSTTDVSLQHTTSLYFTSMQ